MLPGDVWFCSVLFCSEECKCGRGWGCAGEEGGGACRFVGESRTEFLSHCLQLQHNTALVAVHSPANAHSHSQTVSFGGCPHLTWGLLTPENRLRMHVFRGKGVNVWCLFFFAWLCRPSPTPDPSSQERVPVGTLQRRFPDKDTRVGVGFWLFGTGCCAPVLLRCGNIGPDGGVGEGSGSGGRLGATSR